MARYTVAFHVGEYDNPGNRDVEAQSGLTALNRALADDGLMLCEPDDP